MWEWEGPILWLGRATPAPDTPAGSPEVSAPQFHSFLCLNRRLHFTIGVDVVAFQFIECLLCSECSSKFFAFLSSCLDDPRRKVLMPRFTCEATQTWKR